MTKKGTTPVNIPHEVYCDLTAAKAELSKDAGKMISLAETIAELIRRHEDRKGVVN